MFQFRYGAIKSSPQKILIFHYDSFQFRYGAIKSYQGTKNTKIMLRFNSDTVRSKALGEVFHCFLLFCFNSDTVRSKE